MVVVNAQSGRMLGGDLAKILINDVPVQVEGPEYSRGFHMVIIDPYNGGIQLNKVFDTYKSSKEFERWIDMQDGEYEGSIIAVTCKGECTGGLYVQKVSDKVAAWFQGMGSKLIGELAPK